MTPNEVIRMFALLERIARATERIAVLLAHAQHVPNTGPR